MLSGEAQFEHGLPKLSRMTDLVLTQLRDVLRSYRERDSGLAVAVWKRDHEVDDAHESLFRELLTHMLEDQRRIPFCTHLLFCAKNAERMGDHVTNIAETVHYIVEGRALVPEHLRTPRCRRWRGQCTAGLPL
jgi:phosphate transport system protein